MYIGLSICVSENKRVFMSEHMVPYVITEDNTSSSAIVGPELIFLYVARDDRGYSLEVKINEIIRAVNKLIEGVLCGVQ